MQITWAGRGKIKKSTLLHFADCQLHRYYYFIFSTTWIVDFKTIDPIVGWQTITLKDPQEGSICLPNAQNFWYAFKTHGLRSISGPMLIGCYEEILVRTYPPSLTEIPLSYNNFIGSVSVQWCDLVMRLKSCKAHGGFEPSRRTVGSDPHRRLKRAGWNLTRTIQSHASGRAIRNARLNGLDSGTRHVVQTDDEHL